MWLPKRNRLVLNLRRCSKSVRLQYDVDFYVILKQRKFKREIKFTFDLEWNSHLRYDFTDRPRSVGDLMFLAPGKRDRGPWGRE